MRKMIKTINPIKTIHLIIFLCQIASFERWIGPDHRMIGTNQEDLPAHPANLPVYQNQLVTLDVSPLLPSRDNSLTVLLGQTLGSSHCFAPNLSLIVPTEMTNAVMMNEIPTTSSNS